MTSETTLIIRLQSLDQRITDVQKDIAELPKRLAQIEKALDQHTRRLEADRAALVANQRDRKKLDSDIQAEQQKISKLRDQMLGAKTNEQYRAFQNEIEFCEAHIRKFEDKILELMSESEPLDKNVKLAEERLKAEKQNVDREKKETQARTALDKTQFEEFQAERKQLTSGIKLPTLKTYERIRKKVRGGIAIVEATEGRCGGCQMALRPQFFQDLKLSGQAMCCEAGLSAGCIIASSFGCWSCRPWHVGPIGQLFMGARQPHMHINCPSNCRYSTLRLTGETLSPDVP